MYMISRQEKVTSKVDVEIKRGRILVVNPIKPISDSKYPIHAYTGELKVLDVQRHAVMTDPTCKMVLQDMDGSEMVFTYYDTGKLYYGMTVYDIGDITVKDRSDIYALNDGCKFTFTKYATKTEFVKRPVQVGDKMTVVDNKGHWVEAEVMLVTDVQMVVNITGRLAIFSDGRQSVMCHVTTFTIQSSSVITWQNEVDK